MAIAAYQKLGCSRVCGTLCQPRCLLASVGRNRRSRGLDQVSKPARLVAQAAVTHAGDGDSQARAGNGVSNYITGLLNVYSDPRCNSKLLALAVGQMLCSVATLIHDSYLPIYVQDELGLSNTSIGAVQGVAQFLCQVTKGVSGVAGDILGSQVRVLVFGTFLTLICKPMFVALSSIYGVFGLTACLYWFFFAKLMDRMSKGIREAPTKAVMNELARESGDAPDAAYGLRQSLATAGMLVGSTVASLTFAFTGQNYVLTFAVAMIPPALALVWLIQNFQEEIFGTKSAAAGSKSSAVNQETVTVTVTTQESSGAASAAALPVQLSLLEKAKALLGAFRPAYWQALLVVAALYFARFDASFLSLRAKQVMNKSALPMLTLINTLIQVVLTAPLARFSGQGVQNRNALLLGGFLMMVFADCCFGLPVFANPAGMFAGAALLGLHMAMTHSITVSMVASYMPTGEVQGIGKLSGTAVSFTDLLLGFVLASSNTVAGVLSDATRQHGLGNVGCFAGGAAACSAASLLLLLFSRFGELGKDELVARKGRKAKA